jgi:AraC family transcriptional regulator
MQDGVLEGMAGMLVESVAVVFEGAHAPWSDILLIEQHRLARGKWHASQQRDYLVAMTLTARGELECRLVNEVGASKRSCGQGLLCICSSAAWRQSHDSEVLFAAFDSNFVERVVYEASGQKTKRIIETIGFTDRRVEIILLALRAELQEGCPTGRFYGQSLAAALVTRLLWLSRSSRCTEQKHGLSLARLKRVTEYIDANLAGNTSVTRLSELAQLSPRQFGRLFHESTGLSPHCYVLNRRVAAAQTLLVESKLSLAEVSYAIGFPNQAHFTTMFRKKTGVTPNTYRKLRQIDEVFVPFSATGVRKTKDCPRFSGPI